MASVLLLVFLLQLLIHVLNNVGAKTVNDLLWTFFTKLPTPQSKEEEEASKLRREVVGLNREMNATSAQDEFSKWARLRREHDRAKDKYDRTSRSQQDFRTQFDRIATALRWIGTQGMQFFCNFWYSKQAMFWLPQGWVPYHVEWILSFPSAPLGSISINIWAIACASVISMASQAVKATMTLREGRVIEGPNKGEKIKMEHPAKGGGFMEKKEL